MTPRPPVRINAPALVLRVMANILQGPKILLTKVANGQIESSVGVTVGAVCVVMAPVLFISAAADFWNRGDDGVELLILGLVVGLIGLAVLGVSRFPSGLPVARLFVAFVAGAFASLIVATAAHYFSSAATSLDVAVAEAASTVSGTNASVIQAETLSLGITLFRSLGQWLSAAAIIVVVVRIMPHLGVGGLDADGGVVTRSARRLAPKSGSTMIRLLALYAALTGVLLVAYGVAGMSFVESLVHALTTISSGGFSTRSGSIGAFGSVAIEWIAICGMVIAGTSLPLIFRALQQKDMSRFGRSVEFRAYVGLIVAAVVTTLAWSSQWPNESNVREAVFSVISAISTTGFYSSELRSTAYGAESILLILMLIGGMSASVAGGFKVIRLMVLGKYIRRELRRSIHPAMVEKIHLGRSSIGDVAMSRIIGELFLAIMIILPMAMLFSADGLNFKAAFSFAISSLSNVGFAFGLDRTDQHLQALGAIGHIAAAMLMMIGRISATPVFVALGGIGEPAQREIRRLRLRRKQKVIR